MARIIQMPYVNQYGNRIIDDIHNYFPAILYEPEAFRTVGDLLGYVRHQMRQNFDLFTSAQQAYNSGRAHRMHAHGHSHGHVIPLQPPRRAVPVDLSHLTSQLMTGLIGSAGQPSIFDLFGNLPHPTQQSMEPVVVRPTAEQIGLGTVITVLEEDDTCAICQSDMAAGSEARSLVACDHQFHPGCIDTWFQRSVQCPVCRHDIREPAT